MNHYAARVGQLRVYFTSRQAVAYERAYAAYPATPWGLPESAAIDGFNDAKADAARAGAASPAFFTEQRGATPCAA